MCFATSRHHFELIHHSNTTSLVRLQAQYYLSQGEMEEILALESSHCSNIMMPPTWNLFRDNVHENWHIGRLGWCSITMSMNNMLR